MLYRGGGQWLGGVFSRAARGRSPWAEAGRRFLADRAAMIALGILMALVVLSLVGPRLAAFDHEQIDWDVLGNVAEAGRPSLASGHYFGTDELGRDLFARTLQGSRVSLAVGAIGALIAVLVGTLYGAVAGYLGGVVDGVMMRLVDVLIAIPYMFVLILLLVVFGRSVEMIFVGIGLVSWLDMARIARGQTLSLKRREFLEAAQTFGVPWYRVVGRHIVPNLAGVVIVYATLLVPGMILVESFISFLGLGVQEPDTSWGALIAEGAASMSTGNLWQLGFPLAFFVTTIYCFYFIGDGLRDALDPQQGGA